jgi:hypothetical protein
MEAHFAAAAQRAQTGTLSAPEQRVLEDILIRVALGQRVPASLLPARNAAATANVASPAFGAAGSGFFDWLRELFGGLRFTPAFAVAATLILAQAGLIGVLLMRETERDQYYETRSAAPQPAPSGPVLEVNFKPDSSERDIRLALESVGGSIVDGPGQLGNYIVRVAVGQEAAAARKLGASPVVEAVSVLPNVPAKQ